MLPPYSKRTGVMNQMSRYLDPKADIVFKKIFGEHPKLLISFLNALLPLEPDAPIVEVFYLPYEQVPSIPEFKRTIADVKCTDTQGRVFIVEMQMNWTDSFKQRSTLRNLPSHGQTTGARRRLSLASTRVWLRLSG